MTSNAVQAPAHRRCLRAGAAVRRGTAAFARKPGHRRHRHHRPQLSPPPRALCPPAAMASGAADPAPPARPAGYPRSPQLPLAGRRTSRGRLERPRRAQAPAAQPAPGRTIRRPLRRRKPAPADDPAPVEAQHRPKTNSRPSPTGRRTRSHHADRAAEELRAALPPPVEVPSPGPRRIAATTSRRRAPPPADAEPDLHRRRDRRFQPDAGGAGAITEVPDPLDGDATVLQMTVNNSDVYPVTPTEDPRAQLLSPDILEPGDEFWWNSEFLAARRASPPRSPAG